MKLLIKNTNHSFVNQKHKGALYIFIIVLMLIIVMLTSIIATMFDNNLKNAVTQKDNLQLYYYSKAGADWAVSLVKSSEKELATSSGNKKSLADKLREDRTYSIKWTGQGDLKAKTNDVGRFFVTIEKVKKRVDSTGQFVTTGGKEVDYAKITSVGKELERDTSGHLIEGEQTYVMTVLVSLDTLDNVIYMPGY